MFVRAGLYSACLKLRWPTAWRKETRRPASADRTARAANFRLDL